MDNKIQLEHPNGKNAIRIDIEKYELLSESIKSCLSNTALTHKELFQAVTIDFKNKNVIFSGSVEWYMESVKLDLEAKKVIERYKDGKYFKFKIKS